MSENVVRMGEMDFLPDVPAGLVPPPPPGMDFPGRRKWRDGLRGRLRRVPMGGVVVLGLLGLMLPGLVLLARQQTRPVEMAAVEQAQLSLVPGRATLPPGISEQLILQSGSVPVALVSTVVTFDPTKVQLAAEVTTAKQFTTIVQKTSRAEANTTGKISLVLQVAPGGAAPVGKIEVAQIPLAVVTKAANQEATLTFDAATSQVVSTGTTRVILGETGAVLTLNPAATPTAGLLR